MRAATGREPDVGYTAAHCLLALFGIRDPSPDQIAAAHMIALGFEDMRLTAERLKG